MGARSGREMAQIPYCMRVFGEISQANSAKIGAQIKAAPGGASTPLIQGPRRRVFEGDVD